MADEVFDVLGGVFEGLASGWEAEVEEEGVVFVLGSGVVLSGLGLGLSWDWFGLVWFGFGCDGVSECGGELGCGGDAFELGEWAEGLGLAMSAVVAGHDASPFECERCRM